MILVGELTGAVQQPRRWRAGLHEIVLDRPIIVGILNVTPDSFTDGGNFFRRRLRSRTLGASSPMAPTSSISVGNPLGRGQRR